MKTEKHRQIEDNTFISLIPWANKKHVVQVSFGSKSNYIRARSKPISYNYGCRVFRELRDEKILRFLTKYRLE